jgi:hypothetical protein
MISKEKLKRLALYNVDEQQELITLAIQDKISFYVLLKKDGQPFKLHAGQIESVCSSPTSNIKIPLATGRFSPTQQCGWNQVQVNKDEAKKELINLEVSFSDEVLKYSTHLIEIQRKAIKKFWINFDPKNPPKAETIIQWIIDQGVAKRIALAMDSIIRPKPFKGGGNRTRKK